MNDYAYVLLMYEIGEDHEAVSTLNSLVECGDMSFIHCNGRYERIEFLRKATAGVRGDLPGTEDRLRLWMRIGSFLSGGLEDRFSKLQLIMHETEFGPRLGALYRDVLQVEKLREDAREGRIAEAVYQEALEQLMYSGRLPQA